MLDSVYMMYICHIYTCRTDKSVSNRVYMVYIYLYIVYMPYTFILYALRGINNFFKHPDVILPYFLDKKQKLSQETLEKN